jgi:uncharacterized protein YifE (UPF0438 family)
MTEEDGERIYGIVLDTVTPRPGFERHFVQVLKGKALPATPKEREWIEFAREIIEERESAYHVGEWELEAEREEIQEEQRLRVQRMLENHTWEETMEILDKEGFFLDN